MTVRITPDIQYNLRDVINDNYREFHSQFKAKEDASGFKKLFYNIAWVMYRTITMSSDVDLKDFNMRSTNGKGIQILALFKLAVRNYLIRSGFGKFIDEAMEALVWHGSVIVKRANSSVYVIDFRNYITEPNVSNPQERSHAEFTYLSHKQMQAKGWLKKREVKELWEKMQANGKHKFKVIEFWTWNEIKGERHKVCQKWLDRTEEQPEEDEEWTPYIMLDEFITPYRKRRESKEEREALGDFSVRWNTQNKSTSELPYHNNALEL